MIRSTCSPAAFCSVEKQKHLLGQKHPPCASVGAEGQQGAGARRSEGPAREACHAKLQTALQTKAGTSALWETPPPKAGIWATPFYLRGQEPRLGQIQLLIDCGIIKKNHRPNAKQVLKLKPEMLSPGNEKGVRARKVASTVHRVHPSCPPSPVNYLGLHKAGFLWILLAPGDFSAKFS